ncbi:Protein kinase superfamily protein [Raphanus sativus]|uniref:Receptor-like cytoplasmic kinase 185 n=1 Tax=Raphanus sativus TaxID=3726 RepID=A0A6J0MXR9_RAPSA|nr:receptor-like cytoplasmic kinase 185 [Raphanus sativus]KAJ4905483.1 Protein kinase superfamily protein [Raphanus sativus]
MWIFSLAGGSSGSGRDALTMVFRALVSVCCVVSLFNVRLANALHEGPTLSPLTSPVLPLPAEFPPFHRKHLAPQQAEAPLHSPRYSRLVASVHPPTSSRFSKPSNVQSPGAGLVDIAPTQPSNGALPDGLTKPPLSPSISDCCKPDMVLKRGSIGCHCVYPIKLDILLLNVSDTPSWNMFLNEFASQLGLLPHQIELINFYMLSLSRMNISMDITPHSGISFSASQASAINSSLISHKIQFSPTLVGDYKLLNFTWFEAPAPSQAPQVASSPQKAPSQGSSASTSVSSPKKKRHPNLILIFAVAAGVLIAAIISVLVICSCALREEKAPDPLHKEVGKPRILEAASSGGSLPHPASTRFLSYEELKEATSNFESASILGEGGFGKVYRGILADGTAVAIKKLTSGGPQGDREFQVEIDMLSRLHHRNLVKLVGYYSSRDSSQHLLCYELVPNGSLEAWLHGPLGLNCPLDWDTRMKIALDAAKGLAYLHEDSQPSVIHRDFKASNILLENNFNAKVADFGLAKQAPEGRGNHLSTRVMGTFGYVAPEYAMTGHLLVKSDVYSYGVVLLELLTGRKPVDMSQPSGQENLVTWTRPVLRDKDRLEELVDSRLEGKYPKEDFARVCTIAAACVAPEASQRPTMGEVVQSLKMVQRVVEYQEPVLNASNKARPNRRQSSATMESEVSSSMFSSGPYSGLSAFDHENITRTNVFSEDLHEGR